MNEELRNFLGDYDEHDAALDELWDAVQQEILAKLTAATDIEAGLAEIIGEPGSEGAHPPTAGVAEADLDTPTELEAVCAELTDLLEGMDPLGRPDQAAILGLLGIIVVTVLSGVALPAVWSSDCRRREDAQATLGILLRWQAKTHDTTRTTKEDTPHKAWGIFRWRGSRR